MFSIGFDREQPHFSLILEEGSKLIITDLQLNFRMATVALKQNRLLPERAIVTADKTSFDLYALSLGSQKIIKMADICATFGIKQVLNTNFNELLFSPDNAAAITIVAIPGINRMFFILRRLKMKISKWATLVIILCSAIFSNASASQTCSDSNSAPLKGATENITFIENFDNDSRDWIYYSPTGKWIHDLPIFDSVLYCYGPWWVDYNHAPPGAGYLHILFGLHTMPGTAFRKEGFPADWTNAEITLRLRGDIDLKGSQVLLLLQAENTKTRTNHVLVGQPLSINKNWTEQTLYLVPDPNQWVCLGSRYNRTETYGCYSISEVLSNMNLDFLFVLFPLNIQSVEKNIELHKLRAGGEYAVKQELLPTGLIMVDSLRINFQQKR